MDTSRQILRWSIPGWLYLLLVLAFGLIALRATGSIHFADLISKFATQGISVASVAFVAGLGVPIGFVIYQIYFGLYRTILPLRYVTADRGQEILKNLTESIPTLSTRIRSDLGEGPNLNVMTDPISLIKDMPELHRLKKLYRNRAGQEEFQTQWQKNWEIIRYYVAHISLTLGGSDVTREFVSLSDIFHSLGASRVALVLAYLTTIGYILVKIGLSPESFWAADLSRTSIGMVLVSLVMGLVYGTLTINRHKARISFQTFVQHSFHAYFTGKLETHSSKAQRS